MGRCNMVDLQQADLEVEKIYALIIQHKDGIMLDTLAAKYPPKDPTVPYSVAILLADCRVKQALSDNKLYCVAVDSISVVSERDTVI